MEIINFIFSYFISLNNLFIAVFLFFFGAILAKFLNAVVIKQIKKKETKSNLGLLAHAIKYGVTILVITFIIRSYASPQTDYSMVIGLLSAALGFALQKPISGVAAWLIIVLKRPFYIGDRIIIGDVKGDVLDITISHIVLEEVGGTVSSEDKSGRIVHLPTLILFEKNIINYTLDDDYVLDEVTVLLTYESNLEKAEFILQNAANQVLSALDKVSKREPYLRLFFDDSGVNLKVRYFVPALRRQEIASDIVRCVHERFTKEIDVDFAYPHIQLVGN